MSEAAIRAKKNWKLRNPEKVKAGNAAYRKANRGSVLSKHQLYYLTHKDEYKEYSWLKKYGITREDYNRMLAEQNGHCYFCNYAPPGGRYLSIDHDHNTGKVRGLLCPQHNSALGSFGDDVAGVLHLLEYAKRGDV